MPTSTHARARRWQLLHQTFPDLRDMRVLDLGGEPAGWDEAPLRPAELVLVNRRWVNRVTDDQPWCVKVDGDACDRHLLEGERFDLVYCNSVIEHVGGYTRRRQLARNARRLGDAYWVQTPYRYFPLEPHAAFPAFQFLPFAARVAVAEHWPFGHVHGESAATLADEVARLELLSASEMRLLFPEARLVREKVGGVTKSLIAVAA